MAYDLRVCVAVVDGEGGEEAEAKAKVEISRGGSSAGWRKDGRPKSKLGMAIVKRRLDDHGTEWVGVAKTLERRAATVHAPCRVETHTVSWAPVVELVSRDDACHERRYCTVVSGPLFAAYISDAGSPRHVLPPCIPVSSAYSAKLLRCLVLSASPR